jgi:hypothetical protein
MFKQEEKEEEINGFYIVPFFVNKDCLEII